MKALELSDRERSLCLSAMATLMRHDGAVHPKERELFDAVSHALGRATPFDDVDTVNIDTIAAEVTDSEKRERLVQLLIVTALFDGDVTAGELAFLRAWSEALSVDEPRMGTLSRWAHGLSSLTQFDLGFRSAMLDRIRRDTWARDGVSGLRHLYGSLFGMGAEDPGLAARFDALGALPEGTLGRVYHEHLRARGFSFPGERGVTMPKQLVAHDLSHVLGGYDTDAGGETEVIAFVAGFISTDPFWYVFAILMHMHLGTRVFGLDPTAHLAADAHKMVAALRRGMRVNRDLYHDWDYWPAFAEPLEAVRASLNIV